MAMKLILLILPALVLAKIDLYLTGKFKADESDLKVHYKGNSDTNIITETEKNTFDLSDNTLKNAAKSIIGRYPKYVFLFKPTHWIDPFSTSGWKEVTRTIRVQDVDLLMTSFESVVIYQQIFENLSSKPAIANVAIFKEVQNTVLSFWHSKNLSVVNNIRHNVNLDVDEAGGKFSFRYSPPWGETSIQSQTQTIMNQTVDVVLEPGQSVVAQLRATRNKIRIRVRFEAFLSGQIVVICPKIRYVGYIPLKFNRYWKLNITTCMNKSGIINRKLSEEFILVEFYTDPNLIIYDKI